MGDASLVASRRATNQQLSTTFLQADKGDNNRSPALRLNRSRRHRSLVPTGLSSSSPDPNANAAIRDGHADVEPVLEAANRFHRISLSAASRLSLLDRIDVKFACDLAGVARFLNAVADTFSIVEVGGAIDPQYRSVYFDTDDLALYQAHHNARRVRHKIRYRTYVSTDTTFFELKLRQGAERTAKHRIGVPWIPTALGSAETQLLAQHGITMPQAHPLVDIEYRRFTLIGENERVTIDRSLTCTSAYAQVGFDQACIIEIKQPRPDYSSPAYRAVRDAGFRARSISKYCLGVATTVPHAKTNAFKSRLQYLGQLESRDRHRVPLNR